MKKYLISILCGLFLLPGCDYLNMVPEKDIETIESIFEQRTKVEGWWIGVYADLISLLQNSDKNLAFSASDEYTPSPVLYTSITICSPASSWQTASRCRKILTGIYGRKCIN